MLYFAINDDSVSYTEKLSLYFGVPPSMERAGELPGIVILQPYNEPTDFLIGFCDGSWAVQGVVPADSPDEAKRKAEVYYAGIQQKWIESPYSEVEVREYLRHEYNVDPDTEWWVG